MAARRKKASRASRPAPKSAPRPNPRKQAPPPADVNVNYQQERVQCGKHLCRCNTPNSEHWHGPYWYAYWRDPETGKKRSRYVGKHFKPPQGPERPPAHSHRRAPPDASERERAAPPPPRDEPPPSSRHHREEQHRAPPPRPRAGSRFEQAAELLGVSLSASQADAKKAYRKLAIENHPDRYKGAERGRREELMKQINAAWDTYQRGRGWK